MKYRYRLFGVPIDSEVPLRAPPPEGESSLEPPIHLARGPVQQPTTWEVVRHGEGQARTFASIGRVEGGYVLRLHELVDFFIDEAGSSVRYAELGTLEPGVLEQLFVDQALPHALSLRGVVCLHASSVVSPTHGAIGFVGPSGFGKSTLAFELSKDWPFLTDDCMVISLAGEEGRPWVHRGDAASRLWADSAEAVAPGRAHSDRVTARTDKRRVPVRLAKDGAPLVRIYLLAWDEATDEGISIRPVRPRDAVMALAAQQFRLDVWNRKLLADELDRLSRLVSLVPVRRLAFPHDYALLGAVREALSRD